MAQGKFSKPRPHRDEERQIEETFRQVTGQQKPVSQPRPQTPVPPEQPYQPKYQAPQAPQTPGEPAFDLTPEDSDLLFDDGLQPQDAPEEDWIDKALRFYNENKKYVLACLCAAALLLIVGVVAIFVISTADPYDDKILDNVLIGDVDVGGLTKNQAIALLEDASSRTFESRDMVVNLGDTRVELSAFATKAALDAKAAAEAAYAYGRTGTQAERDLAYENSRTQPYLIGVLPYLELDEDYIRDTLNEYSGDSGSTLTQTTYGLEGDEPALDYEHFDEDAPTQTLVIFLGKPGIGFDVNDVYDQILDAYSLGTFEVTVEDIDQISEPDPVELTVIYEEFYIAPVDASVDPQTGETIPGSYGYGFDMEQAQKLLDKAEFGEEIRIPMEYIEPEILDADMFFRDVMGSYETRHTNNSSRTTNLKLACEAINGLVLDPGEKFSFNDALGEPTSRKGYKTVTDYSGTELTDILGGGISQVASTLYCSALTADMEIVSRTNHSFLPSYSDYGLDAAVQWNKTDFAFRNSSDYPVRIEAEVSGGYVKVQILGTDHRDYFVELDHTVTDTYEPKTEYEDFEYDNWDGYEDGDVIREGITGYEVKTYKCKYDKSSGELITRDSITNTRYTTVNKLVARVEPEETTEPTTEATEETKPETKPTEPKPTEPKPTETQPTQTQPTETVPPETNAPETIPPETVQAPAGESQQETQPEAAG